MWRTTVQECQNIPFFLQRASLNANWSHYLVATNRRNVSVLSTWIIIMRRKKECSSLFFLSFPLLLCICLILHKCPFYSMIFSSGKSELLRVATVPWDSCSQNFICLCSLQPLISEIQYWESKIWTWGAAATAYSKHKFLGDHCGKMSIKQDTITSCSMTMSSLLTICYAISKTDICSEYVWIIRPNNFFLSYKILLLNFSLLHPLFTPEFPSKMLAKYC